MGVITAYVHPDRSDTTGRSVASGLILSMNDIYACGSWRERASERANARGKIELRRATARVALLATSSQPPRERGREKSHAFASSRKRRVASPCLPRSKTSRDWSQLIEIANVFYRGPLALEIDLATTTTTERRRRRP